MTGAEILAPTGIRSPDRPASSEWLYRLSYPGNQQMHLIKYNKIQIIKQFIVSTNRYMFRHRSAIYMEYVRYTQYHYRLGQALRVPGG